MDVVKAMLIHMKKGAIHVGLSTILPDMADTLS